MHWDGSTAAMLTESGPQVGGNIGRGRPNIPDSNMGFVSMRIFAAASGAVLLILASGLALAQSGDPKGGPSRQQSSEGEGQKKLDEFAEAANVLGGPAANPECVWLGRRVVGLMWRDDLDTAFRHLDLYDRFGCPAGHIQATFRCLVRHGNLDPKGQDTLSGRVHNCWINPNLEPKPAAAPSAGAPTGTANR
jgi:hypothetical protein